MASKKPSSEPVIIDVVVFNIGKPTRKENGSGGNIYPQSIAEQIIVDVLMGKASYDIEEVSPVERRLKKIQPFNAWKEHAMADSVGAKIDDGKFIMSFKIRNNKYGKLLSSLITTNGMENIDFFPVGIGDTGADNVVTKYKLSYISFEVKENKDADRSSADSQL